MKSNLSFPLHPNIQRSQLAVINITFNISILKLRDIIEVIYFQLRQNLKKIFLEVNDSKELLESLTSRNIC